MFDWIFYQPLVVQFALLLPPIGIGGVMLWAVMGRNARLLRRAEKAARRAAEIARDEGLPVRDQAVWGAVDINAGSLAVVFFVENDEILAAAQASGAAARLQESTMVCLRAVRYPILPETISLVSDESVARAGGPGMYFR